MQADAMAERFGRNLHKARRRAGFSQEELAALASLHRTEIGLIEHGKRLPRIDTVAKLAASLAVPVGDLFAGIEWAVGSSRAGSFVVSE